MLTYVKAVRYAGSKFKVLLSKVQFREFNAPSVVEATIEHLVGPPDEVRKFLTAFDGAVASESKPAPPDLFFEFAYACDPSEATLTSPPLLGVRGLQVTNFSYAVTSDGMEIVSNIILVTFGSTNVWSVEPSAWLALPHGLYHERMQRWKCETR